MVYTFVESIRGFHVASGETNLQSTSLQFLSFSATKIRMLQVLTPVLMPFLLHSRGDLRSLMEQFAGIGIG